jgi:hypothetical protein
MIIYKTTNLINGKIYIGQDSKNNPDYFGSGKYFKRALKKYGKENFIKEIIDTAETLDELSEKEIYWIDKLDSIKPGIGYNLTNKLIYNPYNSKRKFYEETRIKLSETS